MDSDPDSINLKKPQDFLTFEEREAIRIERERQEKLKQAQELLEQNPKFAGVAFRVHQVSEPLVKGLGEHLPRLSEERLQHVLQIFDAQAELLLDLITDVASVKAYMVLVDDVARHAWWHLSMLPADAVPPPNTFSKPLPAQVMKGVILDRRKHWNAQGYARLDMVLNPQTGTSKQVSTRERIDTFVEGIFSVTGRKITRKDIWTAAGYQNPTEFERFQRDSERTTSAARASFERVLSLTPKEFVALLDKLQKRH